MMYMQVTGNIISYTYIYNGITDYISYPNMSHAEGTRLSYGIHQKWPGYNGLP